jgi:hypothetical protein
MFECLTRDYDVKEGRPNKWIPTDETFIISRPLTEVRGHTSYLTFATYFAYEE